MKFAVAFFDSVTLLSRRVAVFTSSDHPVNSYPSAATAVTSVASFPRSTVCDVGPDTAPLLLTEKVNVYVTTGTSSKLAETVTFAVTLESVRGFVVDPSLHEANR